MDTEVSEARRLAARSHEWRAALERARAAAADAEAGLAREGVRRGELVGAYWPLMARLRDAQAAAVTLHEQVRSRGRGVCDKGGCSTYVASRCLGGSLGIRREVLKGF
jgi:hypothetical protein